MELLDRENEASRCCGARCLGDIGPRAAVAEKRLRELLGDKDKYVRHAAQEALRNIAPGK